MSLWSHESVVTYYEGLGFRRTGPTMSCGTDGNYSLMGRELGSSKAELETRLTHKANRQQGDGHGSLPAQPQDTRSTDPVDSIVRPILVTRVDGDSQAVAGDAVGES